ncbi:methylcobamide--CoM methyltransferase [Terrisporobacter glycolicus]|uniref:Uroporphyrinogen decarboxylase (URO-D) domain-containing protein n=1 Tax=Terrisporobacter petrolearius TaxID=1460447 RepID=A0ABZ3FGG3_9FIRM|nr:methylcobamide--CoM methyltransferase [Terrisporobacter glycolicus]
MEKIVDFKCTYNNSAGINEEVTKNLKLSFPQAYKHWETMSLIAKELKKHDNAAFCELPFCHTVEGEAMGGIINYGDEKIGPRAKEYVCQNADDVLNLKSIDFTKGRISEVLKACTCLRNEGENVVLEVSGPFTILNVLMDATRAFKIFRKEPEKMKQIFDKFQNEILNFIEEGQRAGANLISFADSSGGVNILGPKMMKESVEMFTYPFLKKAEKIIDDKTILLLCPKTTFALLGTNKASLYDIELSKPMKYGEGCIEVIGKTKIVGQMCIKNINYKLTEGKIKGIKLI